MISILELRKNEMSERKAKYALDCRHKVGIRFCGAAKNCVAKLCKRNENDNECAEEAH